MFRHEGLRPLPYGGRADECKAIKKEVDQKSIVGSLASIIFHFWGDGYSTVYQTYSTAPPSIRCALFVPVAAPEPINDKHCAGGHGPQLADAAETLGIELNHTHSSN